MRNATALIAYNYKLMSILELILMAERHRDSNLIDVKKYSNDNSLWFKLPEMIKWHQFQADRYQTIIDYLWKRYDLICKNE